SRTLPSASNRRALSQEAIGSGDPSGASGLPPPTRILPRRTGSEAYVRRTIAAWPPGSAQASEIRITSGSTGPPRVSGALAWTGAAAQPAMTAVSTTRTPAVHLARPIPAPSLACLRGDSTGCPPEQHAGLPRPLRVPAGLARPARMAPMEIGRTAWRAREEAEAV